MSGPEKRAIKKRHVIKRARERFGVALEIEDVGALNVVIRMGLGRLLRSYPRKHSNLYWVTTLDGVRLPVIYDTRLNSITTVLPHDCWQVQKTVKSLTAKP